MSIISSDPLLDKIFFFLSFQSLTLSLLFSPPFAAVEHENLKCWFWGFEGFFAVRDSSLFFLLLFFLVCSHSEWGLFSYSDEMLNVSRMKVVFTSIWQSRIFAR